MLSFTLDSADVTPVQGTVGWPNTQFGSIWNFWPFMSNEITTSNYIAAQVPDNFVCVGTMKGKGTIFRGTASTTDPIKFLAVTTDVFTVNNDANGIVGISGPTGGMGQFKGLSQSTTEDLYVQVICLSVVPMYYTTWAINLDSGASNGWVVSCYTGIPQC
jgi:hypothetical protein